MTVADWIAVVGVAATLAVAIVAWAAHRKNRQDRLSDLRLKLHKALGAVEHTYKELSELLPYADQSRTRTLSARGQNASGVMQIWKQRYEQDSEALHALSQGKPSAEGIEDLNAKELEAQIAKTHALQLDLDSLEKRYRTAIAEDEQWRAEDRQKWRDVQNRSR